MSTRYKKTAHQIRTGQTNVQASNTWLTVSNMITDFYSTMHQGVVAVSAAQRQLIEKVKAAQEDQPDVTSIATLLDEPHEQLALQLKEATSSLAEIQPRVKDLKTRVDALVEAGPEIKPDDIMQELEIFSELDSLSGSFYSNIQPALMGASIVLDGK